MIMLYAMVIKMLSMIDILDIYKGLTIRQAIIFVVMYSNKRKKKYCHEQ